MYGAARQFRFFLASAGTLFLVLALPSAGAVWLTGLRWEEALAFPPEAFVWEELPAFSLIAVGALGVFAILLGVIWVRLRRKVALPPLPQTTGRFPIWGWGFAAALAISWALAWTRFEAFAELQRYTYIPLWYSFIGLLNAIAQRVTGRCPAIADGWRFWALFPVSAGFWWVFEHMNRFSGNWHYNLPAETPFVEYAWLGSLSFATVLPAVFTLRRILEPMPPVQYLGSRGPELRRLPMPILAGMGAIVAGVGLVLLPLWPEYWFPLLWLAPLGLLAGFSQRLGVRLTIGPVGQGDWRPALSWMLAALVAGFFWEMWNAGSQLRWSYEVPWFERGFLFEMPLAGYTGYLPFGLACAWAVQLIYGVEEARDFPSTSDHCRKNRVGAELPEA